MNFKFAFNITFPVLVGLLIESSTEDNFVQEPNVRKSDEGSNILATLVNGVQLGLKTVMDRVLPSIETPDPTTRDSQFLPLGCPRCRPIDTTKLGGNWRLIYASDNFIKVNLMLLSKLNPSSEPSFEGTNSRKPKPSTIVDAFMPVRNPICVKFQIGQPLSYGFLMDYPVQYAFKSGTASGPLHVGYGNFRLFPDGKLILISANGEYNIKFCIIETNINGVFPNDQVPPVSVTKQRSDVFEDNTTSTNNYTNVLLHRLNSSDATVINSVASSPVNFIILSDIGGFPGCQNFLVLANDELTFMEKYDRYVTDWMKRTSIDSDLNPLQYLGCPCGFTVY